MSDIKLELNYRQLAYIKKLITDKRYRLWLDFSKMIKKKYRNNLNKVCKVKTTFDNERNPWTEHGKCGIILDKIAELELSINKEVRK